MGLRLLAIFEILTIGLPFCVFKVMTGRYLLGEGALHFVGIFLIALGACDTVINVVNLGGLLAGRQTRLLGICTTHQIVTLLRLKRAAWVEFATAIDSLLSFGLISYMLLSGTIASLSSGERLVWVFGTVFNILGAGLSQVFNSVRALNEQKVD